MPRRGNVPKREILPDPVYGSVLVTRLGSGTFCTGVLSGDTGRFRFVTALSYPGTGLVAPKRSGILDTSQKKTYTVYHSRKIFRRLLIFLRRWADKSEKDE